MRRNETTATTMKLWLAAAAKLGSAGRDGGLWRSVRRCSSLAARSGMYLCFKEVSYYDRKTEYGYGQATYVVRPIDLNDGDCKKLPVDSYITFKNWQRYQYMPSSSTLGSRIIFPRYSDEGIEDFCWTDTAKRPMNFEVISPLDYSLISGTYIPPVKDMKMGEIDGKLYFVDFRNKNLFMYDPAYDITFIYDPIVNLFEILDRDPSLSPRPVISDISYLDFPDYKLRWSQAVFFAESKKIVAVSYFGTRCFDVADPDIGWVKVNDRFLESMLSRVRSHSYIITHHQHNDIGDFNLIFSLGCLVIGEPSKIFAFFVSNSCVSAQPIRHSIDLPGVCSDYIVEEDEFDFEFVHLGPKKFGLVLNKFTLGRDYKDSTSGNFVLLITYEYDIVVTPPSAQDNNSKPNVDIKSRLLGIRTFQYEAVEVLPTEISNIDLIGAFMIPV